MTTVSMLKYNRDDVENIECKFVVHLEEYTEEKIKRTKKQGYRKSKNQDMYPPEISRPDTHIVKEWITFKDGKRVPNIRIVKDFRKPFWITKPHLRNHKQKKEFEKLENVNAYNATESDIGREVAMRIDDYRYQNAKTLREVRDSPYVYGLDVSSRAYLKKMYKDRYDVHTPYEICALDIEASVKTEEMLLLNITMKDKSFTAILNTWVKEDKDIRSNIDYLYKKYTPEDDLVRNMKRVYFFCNNEMEMIRVVFDKLHEWQPDLLVVWNIGYDIPKILSICNKYGVKPKDIFSDPRIPKEFRHFVYKEGMTSKMTASGVYKTMDFHEQWHVAECSASFTIVDAMSTYYYVRIGGKKSPNGYGLDSILDLELGSGYRKLKFQDGVAETLDKSDWHIYMSEHRKLEYIVYNNYDTLSMIVLDNKTKDLSTSLPLLSKYSGYDIFNSGPKLIVEDIQFYALSIGYTIGSKPNTVVDDRLLGLDDWIVTLNITNNNYRDRNFILCGDGIDNNIRTHVSDIDQTAGYPNDGISANVSKTTTQREIISIDGIENTDIKNQNINIMFGYVNSLEYCNVMHNMPDMYTLKKDIDRYIKEKKDSSVL